MITKTLTVLPVPLGNDTAPRRFCSALRGSIFKRAAHSTVASNLAMFVFLTSSTASSNEYLFVRSTSFNAS